MPSRTINLPVEYDWDLERIRFAKSQNGQDVWVSFAQEPGIRRKEFRMQLFWLMSPIRKVHIRQDETLLSAKLSSMWIIRTMQSPYHTLSQSPTNTSKLVTPSFSRTNTHDSDEMEIGTIQAQAKIVGPKRLKM
jgi:hypothetical protein